MKTLKFRAHDTAYDRAQTRALLRHIDAGRYRLCPDGLYRFAASAAAITNAPVPPSQRRKP